MLANAYQETRKIKYLPWLPLCGKLDLTYRCNNNCRHCWLNIPADSKEKNNELSFEEIKRIVNEAKAMGCREWFISGGEPMLRSDFSEIFNYITCNSIRYSINTNGSLVTPKIAKFLKRKGTKLVSLYGATASVHDHITRNPGSWQAAMRGCAYLKEAGVNFAVQLVLMKDNYYQLKKMVELAKSLCKYYRISKSWLHLSASGNREKNTEIMRQRLRPREVIELDKPGLSYKEEVGREWQADVCCQKNDKSFLFAPCIFECRDFHIDPYGKMTFCYYIKDPQLRYDLRKGDFKQCWERFIPSLANKIKISKEYKENCGSCKLRQDCCCCPVYGYLEHGNFNTKVKYLCNVARENRRFKEDWQKNHRRYFRVANITIQVESDLPIKINTFNPRFKPFEVRGPGKDTVSIRHHFSLPHLKGRSLGEEFYRRPPWIIYKKDDSWIYSMASSKQDVKSLRYIAIFNNNHTRAQTYNDKEDIFLRGNLHSLTFFLSDQMLIAQLLPERQGCYLHCCGVNFKGKGLLFVGHSGAGKSTMAKMLKGKVEILCDDRIIVRNTKRGLKIYGTWSHGEVPDISANPAPLKAILFLEKAKVNQLMPIEDKKEAARLFLECLIKPFATTTSWWEKTLPILDKIIQEIPCYILQFDKSGKVVDLLRKL